MAVLVTGISALAGYRHFCTMLDCVRGGAAVACFLDMQPRPIQTRSPSLESAPHEWQASNAAGRRSRMFRTVGLPLPVPFKFQSQKTCLKCYCDEAEAVELSRRWTCPAISPRALT